MKINRIIQLRSFNFVFNLTFKMTIIKITYNIYTIYTHYVIITNSKITKFFILELI